MLAELHTEIVEFLAAKLPGVTVEAFTPAFRTRRATTLPACLVELATMEPDLDFGNGRDISRVTLQFEARLIVDPNLPTGWVDLKEFVAIAWWALRDWAPQTANVGPITLKRAGEDVFKPDLAGFLAWVIEWEQWAYLDYQPDEVLPMVSRITATDNFNNETVVGNDEV